MNYRQSADVAAGGGDESKAARKIGVFFTFQAMAGSNGSRSFLTESRF